MAADDGLKGFGAPLKQPLPPNSAKVDTVRVFRDGGFGSDRAPGAGGRAGRDAATRPAGPAASSGRSPTSRAAWPGGGCLLGWVERHSVVHPP